MRPVCPLPTYPADELVKAQPLPEYNGKSCQDLGKAYLQCTNQYYSIGITHNSLVNSIASVK